MNSNYVKTKAIIHQILECERKAANGIELQPMKYFKRKLKKSNQSISFALSPLQKLQKKGKIMFSRKNIKNLKFEDELSPRLNPFDSNGGLSEQQIQKQERLQI